MTHVLDLMVVGVFDGIKHNLVAFTLPYVVDQQS